MYNVPQSVRKKLADRYRCIEFIYKNIEDAVSEGMQDEKVEVYWGNTNLLGESGSELL